MDLKTRIEKRYPEKSHGGQCVAFLHKLVEFPPTGNYLKQKIASVKRYGILAENLRREFRVGDIVITNESKTYGHGALVNDIIGNHLQFTESNYYSNEKVSHTRKMRFNSPSIIGVIRGKLLIDNRTMNLVNDSGTIFLITGNKDKRKIGIADEESLGMFGDEEHDKMNTVNIPEYQTIAKKQIINK